MAVIEVLVEQTLELIHFVGTNQKIVNVVEKLAFVQSGDDHEPQEQVTDHLNYVQATASTISGTRNLSQTLEMSDSAYHSQVGYAYQNLSFVQTVYGGAGQWPAVTQTLGFTEATIGIASKQPFHILTFQEKIRLNRSFGQSVNQTLAFNQHAVIYKEDVKWISPDAVIPNIPTNYLAANQTLSVTLNGVGSVILPAPEFGNTESYGQTRIMRETRGGELIVFRDSIWPDETDLVMKFSYLTQNQVRMLKVFALANLGQRVSFTDFEGNSQFAVITNPEVVITQSGRSNYTVELKVMKINA